jgi:hypothetical protein
MLASFAMLISHALISTNSFLLVDAVARRFKTSLRKKRKIKFLKRKILSLGILGILIYLIKLIKITWDIDSLNHLSQ